MADETRQPQPKPPLGPLNRGIRDRLRRLSVGHVLTVYDLAALHDLLDMEALPQANEPRAIVRAFALLGMERKLAANDGVKGTWRDTDVDELQLLMRDELREFVQALDVLITCQLTDASDELLTEACAALRDEAADVANYLVMLCDVVGALPSTGERGR